MKKEKILRRGLVSAFCALALIGSGLFASCSDGDDSSENESSNTVKDNENENKGETGEEGEDEKTDDTIVSDAGKITLQKNSEDAVEYASITAALAAIPSSADSSDTYTIALTAGTYAENALRYAGKAALVIEGQTSKEFGSDVIIAGKGSSQATMADRCLFSVTGSANLTLKNVTLKNTIKRSEVTETNSSGNKLTQAEALSFFSTGKLIAYNSGFYSHQDTLYTRGRAWFYKCYAEGDVDFLWMSGDATVALYEECTIKMTAEESPSAAYVAAPGLPESSPVGKGLVILNSKVIADSALNGSAYLARTPWSSGYYSQAAYIGSSFEGNINKNIWYGSAIEEGIDDDNVGWKIDSASASSLSALGCDTSKVHVLSDRIANREYNGRYTILNRAFNTNTSKWESLSEKWDAASDLVVNDGDSISEDSSKSNIFVDYADVTKTNIGDALTLSDYDGEISGAEWKAEVFSDIDLTEASAETVTVDSNGLTSTESSKNIYVKVSASKDQAGDYVILYSVTATAIKISEESASVAAGSEKQLSVSFEPEGADAEVEWTSSNANVTVEAGLVKVLESANAGETATITATVKDNDSLSATCEITVTEAAVLKKFGNSVASLESFTDYKDFGASDVLIYPVAIDASKNASATYEISAVITYSAVANGGAGFVSFKDGAYSDGEMRSYAWTTPAGVKSYDGFSGHGQGYDKDYKEYANVAGTYTVKAYTKKDGYLYFSLTNSDGVELIKNTVVGYYVPCESDYIYLAVGGASGISVSASDITITVKTDDEENSMKVAKFVDLDADGRTTLSGSGSASYEMTADDFSSYKGMEDTIDISKISTSSLSVTPAVDGSWKWDGTGVSSSYTESYSVKNSGSDFTAKVSFIPSDRSTYKAVLAQEVSITVTDSRAQASGTVVTEKFDLGSGTLSASEDPSDDVVSASNITWNNTVTTADTATTLASIGADGKYYIPYDLTSSTAEYSYQTTISATKAAKITAIKAEAGASGSTGNVQTDVYLSMDGGSTWTQIGSIKQNSKKSAYTPLDYSEEIEIDASTSALIQFRPYWTAARSSASFTSLSDFTVTVQYE